MTDKQDILERITKLEESVERLPDDAVITNADIKNDCRWSKGLATIHIYIGLEEYAKSAGLPFQLIPSPYKPEDKIPYIGIAYDTNGVMLYQLMKEGKE